MLKHLEKILQWSAGLTAAAALFGIMWLTLFDVTGRKFLNNSIPGSLEITEILMVVVIFGALPLVSWRGEHVVFDTLDPYVPAWLKTLQARLVHLVCAGTLGMMAYLLSLRARRFAEYGDVTIHLQLSLAPVAWLMAALLLTTALVHLLFAAVAPVPGHGATGETP
ncbi:MAG: TRAP transporter small permease [Betaproteobacteria bacterium]|jgi:TRAP-type C4-dicarboxylate transport system permease small subunit